MAGKNMVIIYFKELNDEIARGIRVYFTDNIPCIFRTAVDLCELESLTRNRSLVQDCSVK